MSLTSEMIFKALSDVVDGESGKDVVAAGMVSGVTAEGGHVRFLITIDANARDRKAWLQEACEKAVKALPGVKAVTAVLTAESRGQGAGNPGSPENRQPLKPAVWNKEPLAHVKRIIAVASGKGGVGKSTATVNLAHALIRLGRRAGILDADIHGPSVPRMLGVSGKPEVRDNKILPLSAHGMPCLSMGFLVPTESAIVWRGPQVSKALHQMLRGALWGSEAEPLDMLLIDMPPGTGDIHLSLVQQAPVDGAVIITTPQDVAVADARKCLDMFRKVGVPILGVIENMSGFTDSAGKHHAIFGEGGGAALAKEAGVPYLGSVPIDITLREASDAGRRFEDKDGIFSEIAKKL